MQPSPKEKPQSKSKLSDALDKHMGGGSPFGGGKAPPFGGE